MLCLYLTYQVLGMLLCIKSNFINKLASKKQLKLITNFKGLHPFKFDCGDVLGIILAQQRSSSC